MIPKKKPNVTNDAPDVRTLRNAHAAKKAASQEAATPKEPSSPLRPCDLQLKTWDAAVQLFSQRRYLEAAELFRQAAQGPAVDVADKARSYGQICERKTSRDEVEFRTAEDHFYFGVERLNARDLHQAQYHFSRALRLEPNGDHIFYTLSLCCGFAGDVDGAYENLKRAIDLDPRNRIMARQDSEFRALAAQFPALLPLLGLDATGEL